MKPGWQTSEAWVTLLTALVPFATLIFHKDVSAYVPGVAALAAAVATAGYSLSRAVVKKAHAALPAAPPVVPPVVPVVPPVVAAPVSPGV